MGSPQGAWTPTPRLGFDLVRVNVLISGLTGVVDAAIKIPTRSKAKSPAAENRLPPPGRYIMRARISVPAADVCSSPGSGPTRKTCSIRHSPWPLGPGLFLCAQIRPILRQLQGPSGPAFRTRAAGAQGSRAHKVRSVSRTRTSAFYNRGLAIGMATPPHWQFALAVAIGPGRPAFPRRQGIAFSSAASARRLAGAHGNPPAPSEFRWGVSEFLTWRKATMSMPHVCKRARWPQKPQTAPLCARYRYGHLWRSKSTSAESTSGPPFPQEKS